jgi:HEAT repeat protein
VKRILSWTVVLLIIAGIAIGVTWYVSPQSVKSFAQSEPDEPEDVWLEHLFSQNPTDAAAAATWVEQLGEDAMPIILETLRSDKEDRERKKAALKACGILGRDAEDAMDDVRTYLLNEELTAFAAAALTFMGPDALKPLKDGLASPHAAVRRESLRSIGKLRERAPLEPGKVVPLLIAGMSDPDPAVREIAVTYLGIVRDRAHEALPVLIAALDDADATVRHAAANAIGEYGPAAQSAADALKKASADKDPEVAREAGRALVNVEPESTSTRAGSQERRP